MHSCHRDDCLGEEAAAGRSVEASGIKPVPYSACTPSIPEGPSIAEIIPAMKRVQIWLLLLLAVLLPIRGALAAAMLCPPAGVGTQMELRVLDHQLGHHQLMDAPAPVVGHDHAMHGHGPESAADGGTQLGATDRCNQCSAFCSLTPLVSSALSMPVPHELGAASFPDLSAPAPSFFSGGQERPPRSI